MSKQKKLNVHNSAIKYLPLYLAGILFLILSQYLSSLISIFIGQAMSIFAGESEIILPFFLKNFLDTSSSYASIKSLCIIFIGTGLVMIVFRYLRTVFRRLYYFKVETNVSFEFFSHAIRMPKKFISKHSTGDIIQRNIQDSHKYSKFIGECFFRLFYSLIAVAVILINIFSLSITNFLISLGVVLVVLIFQFFYSFIVLRKKEEKLSAMWSKVDSVNQQTFTNIMMVKSFAGEEKEIEKLSDINLKTNAMQYDVDLIYAKYWAIIDFFSVFYKALTMLVICFMFVNGKIGFGVATSLILYNADVISNIEEIMEKINSTIRNSVASKRLNEYLFVDDDFVINGSKMPVIDGSLEIENLTVKYDEKSVLKNINLKISPGETIGIIGKSGSGKTSLVNALTRINDEYEGSVKISGVELKEIEKHYLRENVGIVNQDSFVFSTSVKNNITILNPSVNDEKVKSVTEKVCFDDDIKKFKNGYDTVVGERGVTLSGGQKQRISIARTMLKDFKILFLDDCLSALDNNVAKQIKTNIRSGDTTCFIISHNLLNVMDANLIIVLDKGEIVEQGTHEELLKLNGIYSEIWNLQQKIKEDKLNDEKS